ncbi:MAG TPA: S41 family peptidase, partial [Candidatus Dormibacteraeota bacterium]|nr:S41 family peptidase [Candidatus Dormibacteraeota bacterium]
MNRSVALRGGAVALLLVIGFVAGVYVDQAYPDWVPYIGHRNVGSVDMTEVQQAARLIQANYVDGSVNKTKLSQGTVQGLVNALGDPYSAYFDPDQYKRLLQGYNGRYTGIGIYLSFHSSNYPVITGTIPGSPAAAAGLQAGDEIVKVGDKDTKGITADQASALIQGPDGTKVTLTVSRGGELLTFTIKRAEIQVPTVRSAMVGDRILYTRIYQFGATTSTEFAAALAHGLAGSVGMVLDLREDPGGYTSAAEDVISQFVTSGETYETRGRSGTDHRVVGPTHSAPTIPLIVLVDANSASASEIVAGSLQVHRRARLVGTVTFGKGSVQTDFPLKDGSDLHLTIERWYLPNGQTIDKKGLTPDVVVTLANASDEYDVSQPSLGY